MSGPVSWTSWMFRVSRLWHHGGPEFSCCEPGNFTNYSRLISIPSHTFSFLLQTPVLYIWKGNKICCHLDCWPVTQLLRQSRQAHLQPMDYLSCSSSIIVLTCLWDLCYYSFIYFVLWLTLVPVAYSRMALTFLPYMFVKIHWNYFLSSMCSPWKLGEPRPLTMWRVSSEVRKKPYVSRGFVLWVVAIILFLPRDQ